MKKILFCAMFVGLSVWAGAAQTFSIRPAQPTHYFTTPAPYVNPRGHLVLSLHEISYALPQNLQLQVSLLDAIGRVKLGIKYGIRDNLAFGAGLSSYWGHMWFYDGHVRHPGWAYRVNHHSRHYWPARLGAYLCVGQSSGKTLEWSLTPNLQLGNPISLGLDFGIMPTPSEWWSLIFEAGGSMDVYFDDVPGGWFFLDGGVRVHPPRIPFLSFDGGMGFGLYRLEPGLLFHFDVIFAMITR